LKFGALKSVPGTLQAQLREEGEVVNVGQWQSISDDRATLEIQDVYFNAPIPQTVGDLQRAVEPNLPWAEDHFLERIGGEPLNPGEQYKNWPWYRGNVEQHQTQELQKFSHTYMERYWPKGAIRSQGRQYMVGEPDGIRYNYGDLNDVVDLLARSPFTRQAVLPVWFPEDTGAVHGERVPCSLYYHFLLRNGRLNVYYHIRSCDFFRHFRDDVYLTCRLGQWVREKVKEKLVSEENYDYEEFLEMGRLSMHISSLHVFEAERKRLDVRP
jgi:hypothetical protein